MSVSEKFIAMNSDNNNNNVIHNNNDGARETSSLQRGTENNTATQVNKVSSPNKNSKFKRHRPTQVYFWTNSDVSKWFKRHCADIQMHYNHCFMDHDITGRSLLRLNDVTLETIGISDKNHRDEILREILKLRIKGHILELRDLQNKVQ